MVCMIWPATFGNGVRIGTTVADISGCCMGGLGTTLLISCVWLTASTTLRVMGTTPSGFVVWQDRLNRLRAVRSTSLYKQRRSVLYYWSVGHKHGTKMLPHRASPLEGEISLSKGVGPILTPFPYQRIL